MGSVKAEFLANIAMLELSAKDYAEKNKYRFDLIENGIKGIKNGICDGFDYCGLGINGTPTSTPNHATID